uniref:Protein-tyrosine-phosphatase n=1 Tax=Macrostomum lignano TaxID=282301 RepID=A0A1I8H7P9_9PLAT
VVSLWKSFQFSRGLIFEYVLRLDKINVSSGNSPISCSFAARIVCTDCSRSQLPALSELDGCSNVTNSSFSFSQTNGQDLQVDTGDILEPYTPYRITVWPVNRAGPGPNSTSSVARTLEQPSDPVSSPVLTPDKRQIDLKFGLPAVTRGRIMAYTVSLSASNGSCIGGYVMDLNLTCELSPPDKCNVSDTVNQLLSGCSPISNISSSAPIKLLGLWPWANYSVSVTPVSQTLAGQTWSRTDRTLPDTPDPPEGLNVKEIGDTFAVLGWTPPTMLNGVFQQYWFRIETGSVKSLWTLLPDYSLETYRATPLTQCGNYNFKLLTENNYGNSSEASVPSKTKIGDLSASVVVRNVTAIETTHDTVKLTWKAVTHGLCDVSYNVVRNSSTPKTETGATHLAPDLLPYTWYHFTIEAKVEFNGATETAAVTPSAGIVIRTDPYKATKPRGFACSPVPNQLNKVRCTWQQPDRFNGVPIRYELQLLNTPPGVKVFETLPYNASTLGLTITSLAYIKPEDQLRFGVLLVNTPGGEIKGFEEQISTPVEITPGKAYSVPGVNIQDGANVEQIGHEKIKINLEGFSKAFNDSYGKIRYCRLLVGQDKLSDAEWTLDGDRNYAGSDRGYKRPYAFNVSCGSAPVNTEPFRASSASRLAAPSSVVDETTVIIGSGSEDCVGECNGPLTYEQPYRVYLVACTSAGCSLSNANIKFTTGFNHLLRQLIGGIVGGVLGALLVVAIVVLLIKRMDKCKGGSESPIPRAVAIADFRRYVGFMLRDSELEVHRQFEEIKEAALEREQKDFSLNVATADCNRAKNRYTDILPYDHTRVVLESSYEGPGHAPDDYINANYIKGLDREREFIASQGPIQGTIDDHWRMIYQHKVTLILTLTQCQEGMKRKSERYWPEIVGQCETYDEIKVFLESESEMGSYTVRRMSVTCSTDRNQTEPLQVVQLFYLGWADYNVPNVDDLADFLAQMRSYAPKLRRSDDEPPILVHCSAGVGRTGTLIALDILVRSLELRGAKTINVFETVMQLRACRKLMVQT